MYVFIRESTEKILLCMHSSYAYYCQYTKQEKTADRTQRADPTKHAEKRSKILSPKYIGYIPFMQKKHPQKRIKEKDNKGGYLDDF